LSAQLDPIAAAQRRVSSRVVSLFGLKDAHRKSRRASMLDKRDQLVEVVTLVTRHASDELARNTSLNELCAAPLHHSL
jgi:hypothetical protein